MVTAGGQYDLRRPDPRPKGELWDVDTHESPAPTPRRVPEHGTDVQPSQSAARGCDAEALSRAMSLFDAYSDMQDEDQAAALAALRAHDRPLHDALVRLLVADALEHALDVPPWCVHA